jgi:aminopeptidase YwaD
MKSYLFIILAFILISGCKPKTEPGITAPEIESIIGFLGSEEMGGRYPGSAQDAILADYLVREFRNAGLKLYNRSGLQPFDIVTELEAGEGNHISYSGGSFEFGSDFTPCAFSDTGTVTGDLVFAGYGFRISGDSLSWDDYSGVDVKGKWVMILRGVPGEQEATSPYFNYSEDRSKALIACDQGAAGVILVSGPNFDPGDGLDELKGKQHILAIPVVQLTRRAADILLMSAGADSIGALNQEITSSESPASFETGTLLDITVDLLPKTVQTFNTIAMLRGADPVLRDQYIVIGAHHDHLGMGGAGSSSRAPDTLAVHYGADDNASGVSGVIEIAEKLATLSPARTVVFTTFGAEEMGLVGSKYLVEHPPVDLSAVQAMINLDMVGRLNEERQLQIGGVGTSPEFEHLLDSLNGEYGFRLKFSNEGFGFSDHASFYAKDIPVLFFTTGGHSEYHTPADKPSTINYDGETEVLKFISDVALALADQKDSVAYTEAGPKVKGSSRGRYGGITLGLMPDVTYEGSDGMPVMFVTEGKPAQLGGIQKGDTIVAIENLSVGNVYDYMNRLKTLKEGMDIVVTVKRNGEKIDLVVRI